LRNQLDTYASQEKAGETRSAALEITRQAQAAASGLVEQWIAQQVDADTRQKAARETLSRARQADTRLNLAHQFAELKLKAETAAAALTQTEVAQTALLDCQRLAATSEIKPADLTTLREQQRQLREIRIQQDASATQLRFALDAGRTLQVGDETLAGSGERRLIEATTVLLPGLGRLEIAPGGADLSDLRRKESELADKHAALLQRLGLADLTAVEARHQTHVQHQSEVTRAEATLKALVPHGIETLRSDLAASQARAAEVELALNKLPHEAEPKTEAEAGEKWPSATEAESAEEAAAQSLKQITDSLHQAQLAAGNAQARFEAASRELAAARAVLDAPERAERVATTQRDLVDARAEQATLAARIEALSQQVSLAQPDILRQDVERFGKSAEQHEKRYSERRDTLLRLEVELQHTGAQGLEERHAELNRDLAQARRRAEELRRRANALDHLLNLLRDKRRVLTRKLQAPLQKHLNRYLQLLFPLASLEIDEDLSPGPLTRTRTGGNGGGNESGEFETLSFGAREQMGVISRLAYADLLKEAGRPTLIILDDALVHSDEDRLAQMKRVLFDAATRHQILLFSCHPANWRDLGVGARSLLEIRAV
jgi:hypothetical protein